MNNNEMYCLGLKFLGTCGYDPSKTLDSYFSLGELIAVIALLLAFYQVLRINRCIKIA